MLSSYIMRRNHEHEYSLPFFCHSDGVAHIAFVCINTAFVHLEGCVIHIRTVEKNTGRSCQKGSITETYLGGWVRGSFVVARRGCDPPPRWHRSSTYCSCSCQIHRLSYRSHEESRLRNRLVYRDTSTGDRWRRGVVSPQGGRHEM